jgi:hypothetical protein
MQSFETRMRRVVQKENNDLQSSSSASAASSKTTLSSSSRGAEKRRTRQRQPIQCGLIIIVLSPIVILLLFICSSRIYNTWSLSNEIELSTILTTKEADEQEVNNKINKNKKINNNNKSLLRRKEDQKLQKHDEDKIKQQKEEEEEEHKNAAGNNNNKNEQKKILVFTTSHGNIRITLRPDLSQGSVDYIYKLVESYGEGERCMHCNLYRSEKPGILQGIMENKNVVPVNTVHGSCPPDGVAEHIVNDCPEWDKNCGCHGPVMTRGSVAWAAGDAGGPDFFIDGYPEPAKWWGTQHTNFGTIEEEDSLKILDFIFTLPTTLEDGMDFLKESIHFDLRLE